MAAYSGRKGVVYLSTSGSGNATNVLGLSQWSLSLSPDMQDVTPFGATNKQYVMGIRDATASISGFWRDDETKLIAAIDSADGVKFYLYPSADAPSKYAYGTAWFGVDSIDVQTSGAVSVSGNLAAAGNWGLNL